MITFIIQISPLLTQWSNDPAINTRVADAGLNIEMTSDGNGGVFIVFENSPTLLRQLWVQHLDKYGYAKFPDNGIRVSGENINQYPGCLLTSDQKGGVIIVFDVITMIEEETYSAVYAQRVDSNGTKLWGDVGIEIATNDEKPGFAAICSDGEGGVVVFWTQNFRNIGQYVYDLKVQRIDAEGNLLWGDDGIVITNYARLEGIQTVLDNNNNYFYIFVFHDPEKKEEIFKLNHLDKSGELIWQTNIEPFPDRYYSIQKLIPDNIDGVLCTAFHSIYSEVGIIHQLVAQKINSEGIRLWEDNGILISENVDDDTVLGLEMAYNNIGDYIFIWQAYLNNIRNLYAQKLNDNGEIIWGEQEIIIGNPNTSKYFYNIGIADDGNLNSVIVWKNNDTEPGLYATLLNSEGYQVWQKRIANDKKQSDKNSVKVISDLNGGAIICWYEINNRWGIYAQQINKNSELGTVLPTKVIKKETIVFPAIFQVYPGYPNPFNSIITIQYQLSELIQISLSIYDISGKEIIELFNDKQYAGNHTIQWNGKDSSGKSVASGMYFIQIKSGKISQTQKIVFIR